MKKFFLMISVFLGLMVFVLPAQATLLTFGLDFEFSGATPPEGLTPWITATFDDSVGGDNTVRLTMSALNLTDNEFIDDWLFNFDTSLDPTLLTFAFISVPGVEANSVNTGVDAFQADGDGKFDIEFDFPPPPGAITSKFTSGGTVVYDITYPSEIGVSAFDFFETGGEKGTFYTAAHIQGIGTNDEYSGWASTPVPEPATMLLFGFGLIGLAVVGRKKFQQGNIE